jgi:hypothetical protein
VASTVKFDSPSEFIGELGSPYPPPRWKYEYWAVSGFDIKYTVINKIKVFMFLVFIFLVFVDFLNWK